MSQERIEAAAKATLPDRFWEKVDSSADCWNWIAGKTSSGYGYFRHEGSMQVAHRVSYEAARGPVPDGMQLDHQCHNRACVRPSHLLIVTNQQNQENRAGTNANNKSGYLGVSWYPRRNQWRASVKHGDKFHHVGYFDTASGASQAAAAKRAELFSNPAVRTVVAALKGDA